MNAYHELQISGIHWPDCTPAMLSHQFQVQATPRLSETRRNAAIFQGVENQMAESLAAHAAALHELRRYFVLPADSSVLTFLSGRRTLPQILLEAVVHLRACFGADSVFNLRAPIDESGSQTLYAVAMWPGAVRDVRRALACFDDTWWIAQSRRASGCLEFTYELV